ncbi:primary-amine oxidase [Amycolatopsis anabasis]|uniref:primary-amine oxidase n=1 Tax=Amycolatopsis anabasis TaxID=1840409 RepID=UPI00131AF3A2|nr:primary-amine oxidase [Amycolatopsis anabasis]
MSVEELPAQLGHPLEPLTAAEIDRVRTVLAESGRTTDTTRYASVLPLDPSRAELRTYREGDPFSRRAEAVLVDIATGAVTEAVVDPHAGELLSWRDLDVTRPPYGQPAVLFEEYERSAALVKADPRWQRAMARRGVADPSLAFVAPLAPGFFDDPDERGKRLLRALTFVRTHDGDSPWAHPVEGLLATVDLIAGEVIRFDDVGDTPIPAEPGNYDAAAVGPARTSLKPLAISQPEGPSFRISGNQVTWENWRFRIGFNAREGLTLHQIGFTESGVERPVLHRASIPEMVVPYGDPSPWRRWISYFDAGEYLLGRNANALRLGCDCLGEIHYFDAVVADDTGHPVRIPRAVCLHEEDDGILWKHTDLAGRPEVRRARRLVVSFFTTVGNYDYGFYWYFGLDGTIELEAKATGIVFCGGAEPGTDSPYASEIAPGLLAPVHQHLFCARLDLAVAGDRNSVEEIDVVGVETGPDNPYGNAFTTRTTPLDRESRAARVADPARNRVWRIFNPDSRNRLGRPRGYVLVPRPGPTLLAQPGSSVHARAAFATRHVWVTRYAEDERYPAGNRPNQHAGGAGLPAWTAADRDLTGTELVLWHVFGPTHVPRPEDWPVMPVDRSGFALRPTGFCDRNPALDLPANAHCERET